MSVIAVGNQIDCTHRPSKYLYSHIQQTSARVPKYYQSTETGNRSDVMNIFYTYVVIIILLHVGHKLAGYE